MTIKIGIVIGSLRKDAFSKKIANNIIEMLPEDFEPKILEIGNLPLYNQDYDFLEEQPKEFDKFRREVSDSEAYIFVTPEYNRSIPGVLKNAIDVASRPWGENVWGGKPGAVISSSIGAIGGFGAYHHLRQILSFVDVSLINQPEMYLSNIENLLKEDGSFVEDTEGFVKTFVESYEDFVRKFIG